MKKTKLFLCAACAATIMSCSQDENIANNNDYNELINSGAILFATNNAKVRASGETVTNLTSFYVTAVNNNDNYYFQQVQFNSTADVFTSTETYYWPTTRTLSFYAVNEKGTFNKDASVPT